MKRSDFFKKLLAFAAIPFIPIEKREPLFPMLPKLIRAHKQESEFMFGDGTGMSEKVFRDFSEFVTKSWSGKRLN